MINYNHLYYFFVTARSGGVTEAARELHIAQPSLSAQIKVLEGSLNRRLFERVGRRLRLTTDGELIYGHCRKIFEASENLERDLEAGLLSQSRLHIGVSNDIERPFLVEMIGRIHRTKGALRSHRIKMSSDSNDRLFAQLRSRTLDAVISSEPVFDPELATIASAKMPVCLAFCPGGRFKALSDVSPSQLRHFCREEDILWALPQRTMRLRSETDAFFERTKLTPEVSFESDVMTTIVRAVADDVGVALLPRPYIRTLSGAGRIRCVGPSEGFWQHGIWLTTRRKDAQSSESLALLGVFKLTVAAQK